MQASLLGTALTFFNPALIEQAVLGVDRVPSGNRQTSAPTDIFRTRDGHVLTHVVGNGLFRRLATVIGEQAWLDHPDYASDDSRGRQRDAICARVAAGVPSAASAMSSRLWLRPVCRLVPCSISTRHWLTRR